MYAVIMAGGKGARFWPRSRMSNPKQLLDIVSARTMIQETVDRVVPLIPHGNMLVVTNSAHADDVKAQLAELPAENIIIEPFGRNTAPCIGLAASWLNRVDPEAIMVVLPADHYIGNREAFLMCLERAAEAARTHNALITIGIVPQTPETGYGYIEYNRHAPEDLDVYAVNSFHEKPAREKAEEYIRMGNFLWNSGMFVWKVSAILRELETHLPDIYRRINQLSEWWGTPDSAHAITAAYAGIESISIDYGVLEKSRNVMTLRGEFDWNDIGSWSAMYAISAKDNEGNVVHGDVVAVDSHRVLAHSPHRLTALVGVKDIVVIDTPDALLICAQDKAQDVKKVVDVLERDGRKEYL